MPGPTHRSVEPLLHGDTISRMPRRLIWIVVAIVATPFAVALVLLQSTMSGQEARLYKAVPGFECPAMRIVTRSARRSWSGRREQARSALYMPPSCRSQLEELVSNGRFREEECGIADRCWRRRIAGENYYIRFSHTSVGFSYSR